LPRDAPKGGGRKPLGSPAGDGERNNTLFRLSLRHAPACDTFDALLDAADGANLLFLPPMPEHEVVKTAESAWHYQQNGRNFVGRSRRVYHLIEQVEVLSRVPYGADALLLLSILRAHHWDHPRFAASPEAMARGGVVADWGRSHDRYRRALAVLVETGILAIVNKGGAGRHDPRQFRFT
jgi:Primase C terminal 1 (PriCT-1)